MSAGEAFGELALLKGEPRMASVTAVTDMLVMVLPRNTYLKYFEPA
jgi:CRP-like cAMP-binding protein